MCILLSAVCCMSPVPIDRVAPFRHYGQITVFADTVVFLHKKEMAKKGNKKNTEKNVKKEMKEEEKTVAPIQKEKKEVPKEEPACTEEACCTAETCCTKCCCCKSCGCCCCPLRLFLLAVVLTIGFVFYLIVRDVWIPPFCHS